MRRLRLTLIWILLFCAFQQCPAKATELAVACKWDSGDLISAVSVTGTERVSRTYETEQGAVRIEISLLDGKKFDTRLEFTENGKHFFRTAHCLSEHE